MTDARNGVTNRAYEIDHIIDDTNLENINLKTKFQSDEDDNSKSKSALKSGIKDSIKTALKYLVHIVVVSYFAYATYHYIDVENHECDSAENNNALCGIQFCSGYGFLVLLFGFVYLCLFYFLILKPTIGKRIYKNCLDPMNKWWMQFSRTRIVSSAMIGLIFIALAIFLYFETYDKPSKLISLIAPCFFILMGFVFSTNRRAIKWRTVITGIVCQFLLGIFCIRWSVGRKIFQCFGDKVATFLGYSDSGSRFVYGDVIVDNGVFAFSVLTVIFFFSFIISILYYLGAMQWVVLKLGWILQQILGTTVCESVTSAANIFLGMSESPLLIKPYIKILTASEMHSIMVSGFATVSGSVLAAYLSFGASAAHLITSSVMAAPATLAISKLYMPETEESKTSSENIKLENSEDTSLLDAATTGANNAIPIVLGIAANIIAFVSFISFLNGIVAWFGFLVGLDNIDFEWIFSKLFIPLAWAMGVPFKDCAIVAKVIATKTIVNEFVAYERLGEYTKNGQIDSRSSGITTFAVCGFANPSSLGILIGSLSVMAPSRKALITSVAFRAFIVGSIVCFISASFAGILMQEEEEQKAYNQIFNSLERKNISISF